MNKKSAKPNSTSIPYSKKKTPYDSVKSSIPNGRIKISKGKNLSIVCWRVFCKKFLYIHTFIAPSLDFRDVVSRKDVSAVTMNMTGRVGLGLTPRYKIEMVKEYLSSTKPDILIIQDCIDCSDMVKLINLLQLLWINFTKKIVYFKSFVKYTTAWITFYR